MAGKPKVKIAVSLQFNPYDGRDHLLLIPTFDRDANQYDWIQAIKSCFSEIEYWQEHQELPTKKKMRGFIADKWKVFKRDGFKCKKCESQENLELDHIVPFSKGGSDDMCNLQTLCKRCNLKKSNK